MEYFTVSSQIPSLPPRGRLHCLLMEILTSSLWRTYCIPLEKSTVSPCVLWFDFALFIVDNWLPTLKSVLFNFSHIGLVATFLLSFSIDPLVSISLVYANIKVGLCYWCQHYVRTLWPLKFRCQRYSWLIFYHELCCIHYGWNSILSKLLLEILRSDLYSFATCVVSITLLLIFPLSHHHEIPLLRDRDRTSI